MEHEPLHPRRRVALLAGAPLLLALLCGALVTLALTPSDAQAARDRELRAATARWQARPFARYRMVSSAGDCKQSAEIDGDRFVWISREPCFDSLRSIDRLFEFVERARAWSRAPRCSPLGCACVERRIVYAEFDEQYGYPRAIRLRKHRWVDWAYLIRNPAEAATLLDCSSPPDADLMVVTELQPLP